MRPDDLDDIAWLAGLLEGEGHFTWDGTLRVVLRMTDADVVASAARLMETTMSGPYHCDNPRYKPIYVAQVQGRRARAIMAAVANYMGKRRSAQIARALELDGQRTGQKLDAERVRKVRWLYANGVGSMREIASIFGVSHGTIQGVINGRIWSHVE